MLPSATRTLCLIGFVPSLLLAACSSPTGADEVGVPVVQLFQSSVTIPVGDAFQAALLPMLPPGYVPSVTWSSSHPSIATVTATGPTSAEVRGHAVGEAVIRVVGDGAQDSLRVTVSEPRRTP